MLSSVPPLPGRIRGYSLLSLKSLTAALASVTLLWAASVTPSLDAAPAELVISRTCSPANGLLTLTFYWQNDPAALAQWVDVGPPDGAFRDGTYTGYGPLHANVRILAWQGFQANTLYSVRVTQLLPSGRWSVSPTFYFETGFCVPAPQPAPCPTALCAHLPPGSPPLLVFPPSQATAGLFEAGQFLACHPSYAGVCLDPDAEDYDCEGGGDGPLFVRGPIRVIGDDEYDLDADGDGIGCEASDLLQRRR